MNEKNALTIRKNLILFLFSKTFGDNVTWLDFNLILRIN